jgi:hypothetical protein
MYGFTEEVCVGIVMEEDQEAKNMQMMWDICIQGRRRGLTTLSSDQQLSTISFSRLLSGGRT